MKRKILSILLCIAVCITMMPVAAYAADISTGIRIAGTTVTSEGNVTGDNIASGTVSYEVEKGNRILTLMNATINGQIYITGSDPVTIKIEGTNTITGPSGSTAEDSGIYLTTAKLTISGDDSDASLQVTSNGSTAIYCNSSISFKNVNVTAIGIPGIENKSGSVQIEQSIISSNKMTTATGIIGDNIEITNAENASEFKSGVTKSLVYKEKTINNGLFTIDNQFDDYQLELFGDIDVTSRNVDDLLNLYYHSGVSDNTPLKGELSYNPKSSTLTLTKAVNTYNFDYGTASAIIKSGAPLTISLNDMNSLKNSGEGGVISAAEPLKIKGVGSLSAESKNSFAIKCEKNLNVTGSTIIAIGKTHAIESGSITISGGTIKAKNDPEQGDIVIKTATPITAADGMTVKLINCKYAEDGSGIQIIDRNANDGFAEIQVTEKTPAAGGVAINAQNFPDATFRGIVSKFDENNDSSLSAEEISEATLIDCHQGGITNLVGIEHFTALRELYCYDNQLTTLDVSKNKELEILNCFRNQLTSLDVSQNTKLRSFTCSENQLTELHLNSQLKMLYCQYNKLAALDVSSNSNMTDLDCSKNKITTLDVTKNTKLEKLDCSYNQLAALDVSKNIGLTRLECYNNLLTALDISANTALEALHCGKNRLTALDISSVPTVYVNCEDNACPIILTKTRTFDLSTLPAFDVKKVISWDGGTVKGNTLTVEDEYDEVTYTYDCGGTQPVKFVLKVDGVLGDPISLPVRTIESKDDTDFVLRSNLSARFTPVGPATADKDELNGYGGALIDYIHPAAVTPEVGPEAGYTKHAVYHIYIPLTAAYAGDTINGILTLPLPSNFDGASAKLIKNGSNEITITKAGGGSITLNAELKKTSNPNSENAFMVSFAVQYKEASSGGSSSGGSSGGSYTPVQKPDVQPVSGGKTELSKDGSTLEITPNEGMEIGTVTVNGKEVTVKDGKLTGLKTGDKVEIAFIAKAPTKAESDKKASAKLKKLGLTVKTSKDANKNIKATVQTDKALAAVIKELKAAGYTVKYKFYRSEKKGSEYKRMLIKNTRSYLNTTGSEDTHYYYKVRLAIYDKNGKLVAQTALKQCDAGHRTWTK